MILNQEQCRVAVFNMRKELKEYLHNCKLRSLVIGESGGIDSALCSVLAAPVCEELGISLLGRSITIETNKRDEIERGKLIGKHFCTNFEEVELTDLFRQVKGSLEFDHSANNDTIIEKLRQGNIKARMRMIYLYDLAQRHGGLVLSTDNYTEYLLGFWTLHGDVGDYGMIQSLWKMEVYCIAQYLVEHELHPPEKKMALQLCIAATPTDGLGITDSDLEQLGASSYKEVDEVLKTCLNGTIKDPNHLVVLRYFSSMYKRNNPLNLSRETIFSSLSK